MERWRRPRSKTRAENQRYFEKIFMEEPTMKVALSRSFNRDFVECGIVIASCVVLWGCGGGGGGGGGGEQAIPLTVPKAACGPNDHPETALQGQVPAALRATGFQGFNCNLELIRQRSEER